MNTGTDLPSHADGLVQKPLVTLNEEATLAEMERMGRGLIVKITKQVHGDGEATG